MKFLSAILLFCFYFQAFATEVKGHIRLALPRGVINPRTYTAGQADRDMFRQKLDKSKVIYEESGGEDDAGTLYGAMVVKLESIPPSSGSPIYLVNSEELAAMVDYSGERYWTVNAGLRGDSEKLKKTETWIRLMISGLNKLPNHRGVVYRGLGWGQDPDQVALKKYADLYATTRIHAEMVEPAFLSSTFDPKTHFVTCTPFVFKIHSKEGKIFVDFSTRPEEAEVLFRPLTKFRVLKKKTRPINTGHCSGTYKQQYMIEVEEM